MIKKVLQLQTLFKKFKKNLIENQRKYGLIIDQLNHGYKEWCKNVFTT